jgi:hypothetical protein
MPHPRSWLAGFFLTVAAVIAGWVALPMATSGARLGVNRWIHEGLTLKLAAAAAREGAVLLLGGSSVHFGMSARRLEAQLGRPAVNIGQHAGLGRPYILSYGVAAAKPGDLVVLSLEYNLWGAETSRSTRNYFVLAHDIDYLYSRRPLTLLEFVAGVAWSEWRDLLLARLDPTTAEWPAGAGYQPATIDAWGDEIGNTRPVSARPPALDDPAGMRFAIDDDAIDEVVAFRDRVVREGGEVAIAFPGLLRRHFAAEVNRDFYARLVARLDAERFTVLDTPDAAVFDADCLYDYAYHPLRACTEARTDRLAAALRAATGGQRSRR